MAKVDHDAAKRAYDKGLAETKEQLERYKGLSSEKAEREARRMQTIAARKAEDEIQRRD